MEEEEEKGERLRSCVTKPSGPLTRRARDEHESEISNVATNKGTNVAKAHARGNPSVKHVQHSIG